MTLQIEELTPELRQNGSGAGSRPGSDPTPHYAVMRSLAFLALLAVACAPVATQSDSAAAARKSIADELRAAGQRVEDMGPIEQTFFSVPARVYRVEGDDLQVYEYASEEAAAADAAKVQPNGAIGTSMPHWIAPPHFFRRGSTLVIYLGTNTRVLADLERLMGKQFAGQ